MSGAVRMPDFLDRTVDKAFGRQAAIDPRLPSAFEPRAGGFGLEAEEPAAATRPGTARGEAEAPIGRHLPDIGEHSAPRTTPGERPALALRAAATVMPVALAENQDRDVSGLRPEPASFEAAEPHNAAAAFEDGEQPRLAVRAANPKTGRAAALPVQAAMLRPESRVASAAPPASAATPRLPRAATRDDVRPRGTAPPSTATATHDEAKIGRPGEIAPKRPGAADGTFGARRALTETSQAAIAPEPGAAGRSDIADRGMHGPQRLADDLAVVRPAADRGEGVRPFRAKAPQPPESERRMPPSEDGPAPQGALLPIVMPAQRTAFTQSLAAQRRSPPAPQGSDAREAPPSIVNVTIGRVEVRAGAGAAQRPGEKREPKPLSLAEYLKKRSER